MYVDDVERQLWASVIIGLLAAILASVGLAFLIVRPLRSLARATERLRHGDYRVRSAIEGGEVGHLAENFNALAAALEQEDQRRAQYLADLSHELRTPITSLRGYTEGLEDGVFQADEAFFKLMASELSHLSALTQSIEAMQLQHPANDDLKPCSGLTVGECVNDAKIRWDARFQKRGLKLDLDVSSTLSGQRFAVSENNLRQIADNL
nr:histidine kinase dimerization/phospho-acceptor domain-containing protein [Sulfitobacter mediterraneus]